MGTILIAFLGLLVTLAIFYAKDADILSDKSLRFIKIVIMIIAIGTIVLTLVYGLQTLMEIL